MLAKVPAYAHLDQWLLEYAKPALKEETGTAPAEQTQRAEWLVTAAYSLLIGPLCAGLLNIVTPRQWALQRSLGPLNRLFLRAQQEDMPVQVTLNTGKVYIGVLISITDPDNEPDIVKLLPMFSGQRDAHGRMVLSTDYEAVYTALRHGQASALNLPAHWLSQFELAIRADTIVTATLFSPAVYAKFNPDWQHRIAELNSKPAPQEVLVEIRRPPKPPMPAAPGSITSSTGPAGA